MFFRTLSGRFLLLTLLFVLLAEVLIFVPYVARFREDYLLTRVERAQIASLALLASDGQISDKLAEELLNTAGVYNVVLRRDAVRELVLSSPVPGPVTATYDLRESSIWGLMRDGMAGLFTPDGTVIRLIGDPVQEAGLLIEVTMNADPLRESMREYALRILFLSLIITLATAALLFLSVQRLIVAPIKRVVASMATYAKAPEDARSQIVPDAEVLELREAEEALLHLQEDLTQALRQKERLAQLGGAVARISHDLRNILSTASLLADRIETSNDPAVARAAPKLLNSLNRAINLCESTLAFGKAEEPPPRLAQFPLRPMVEDLIDAERMAGGEASCQVEFLLDVPATLSLRADAEQILRVLTNLVRNARQAIEATGKPGSIEVTAREGDEGTMIRVIDTGPGLPARARDNLFAAFQGGARKGGTGLGLVIAAELVRGHGGRLELVRSDAEGTEFRLCLPFEG
ncbi:HAMP domain-containing sensor histidine kinase [Pararhodobacter sp. CCB-MM2]|uniref:sensor histidine kinase n=1 Tax=Pararhodobacter sp. CCB-MM2 TaxID=1786003 RepID=UPI00082E2AC7|nr:HAMP domain-containing sensor histidine kinase [Pararhodobacter sp. CCB-MM2]MCA2012966.1 HAMP domain-containing histidine kinase [Cereibacter sphaeroides]